MSEFTVYRWDDGAATIEGAYRAATPGEAVALHFAAAGVTSPHERRKHYARKTPRASDTQAHVLHLASRQGMENIWAVPLVDGKGSQSRTVGRGATIDSCRRLGWLDRVGSITQAGREARDAYDARQEKRRA